MMTKHAVAPLVQALVFSQMVPVVLPHLSIGAPHLVTKTAAVAPRALATVNP
jgi:hypothetical protein